MDARIVELASRLEDLHPKITRCHVVVDEVDRHKSKGNLFEVHLDLHIPGHEIVATRHANQDAYAAINEAFEVAGRQLEETVRRMRNHTPSP